jgi:DNA-binding Lrp family transcriptional regulator
VHLDQLDLDLLNLLLEEPQAGMREYARVLGVARGTVQARLARLEREGVITGHAPAISPAGLGFTVLAFVHLYLAQGQLDNVVARLNAIPEVLEAHTTTGEGDLLCRVAARSNLHLEEIVQNLLALPGVTRTRTEISLNQRVGHRILPLVQQLRTAHTRRTEHAPGALRLSLPAEGILHLAEPGLRFRGPSRAAPSGRDGIVDLAELRRGQRACPFDQVVRAHRSEPGARDKARPREHEPQHALKGQPVQGPDCHLDPQAGDAVSRRSDDLHRREPGRLIFRQQHDRPSLVELDPPDLASLHASS